MSTESSMKKNPYFIGGCLLAIFLATQPSWAMNGTDLLKSCKVVIRMVDDKVSSPYDDNIGAGFCMGELHGQMIMNNVYLEYLKIKDATVSPMMCFPSTVVVDQLVRVLIKYLEDNPDKLHEDAGVLTFYALAGSFSCSKP